LLIRCESLGSGVSLGEGTFFSEYRRSAKPPTNPILIGQLFPEGYALWEENALGQTESTAVPG
jgi:hypothetical protein